MRLTTYRIGMKVAGLFMGHKARISITAWRAPFAYVSKCLPLTISFIVSLLVTCEGIAQVPMVIPHVRGMTVNVIGFGEEGYGAFDEFETIRRPNFDHLNGHGLSGQLSVRGTLGVVPFEQLEAFGIRKYDGPLRTGGQGRRLIFLDACQGGKPFVHRGAVYSNADVLAYSSQRPVLAATGNIYAIGDSVSGLIEDAYLVDGGGIYQIHMPDGRRIPVSREKVLNLVRYDEVFLEGASVASSLGGRSERVAIASHPAQARAHVAVRESARNLGHLGERAARMPSRSPTINPKSLISAAELPLALVLPYIERDIALNYYRQEYYQFSTVVSQLGDRLNADELEWIKSELESIGEMKQSTAGALMESISYGHGSLLEQQAGSLGVLRLKLERRYPDMGWQRSWSQWFWGYPKKYLPLP